MSVSRFLKEIGRPVAYYPRLANALGSVKATVLLCQLLYWQDKGHNADGWIYKTQEEIIQETGLTRRKQESARKLLVELGLLEETRKGTHGTLHFRVKLEALDVLWSEHIFANGGNVQRPMAETANDECTNPPNANGATRHTLIKDSETTTENTTRTEIDISVRVDSVLLDYGATVNRKVEGLHFNTLRSWRLLIQNRLQEGWSERKLHEVFIGCSKDNWKERKKFNAIPDLLTKIETMEFMINLANIAEEITERNGNAKSSNNQRESVNLQRHRENHERFVRRGAT